MIVKRFKSAITYLNVPSIFLPTFSEKANEGGGVGERKEQRPISCWNQAEISKCCDLEHQS